MMENSRKSAPIFEQEPPHISYMRDEKFAKVYTSDSTQMTKFDKRCRDFPDMCKCISDDGYSKSYVCNDNGMISARGKKSTRKMTNEQREAARERMVEMQARKKDKINSAPSV